MEKFAVDLEKVLDEFEYNEEREENVPTSLMKGSPLPNLSSARQQVPSRPPAASYRRPSFEPINLADADFAASPPKNVSSNLKLGICSTTVDKGTFSLSSHGAEVNNRNYFNNKNDNGVSSQENEFNINKQIILESEDISSNNVWKIHPSIQTDEKPDLLEYNSKNADLVSFELEIQNQLPDLTTSVRSSNHGASDSQVDSLSNSLDLISSTSGSLLPVLGNEGTIGIPSALEVSNREFVEKGYNSESSLTEELTNEIDSKILSGEIKPKDSSIPTEERFDSITVSKEETTEHFLKIDCEPPVEVPLNIEHNTSAHFSIKSQSELDDKKTNGLYENGENESECYQNIGSNTVKNEQNIDDIQDFESQKPVGFSADSDISESDLEDYLKELEELDKTLDMEQEFSQIQNIKSMECDRTVIQSECKVLDEFSGNIISSVVLESEAVVKSNNNQLRADKLECEDESCERITSNPIKEEFSNVINNSCNLKEDSNRRADLQNYTKNYLKQEETPKEDSNTKKNTLNYAKNDFKQEETPLNKVINQKTVETVEAQNLILPQIVQMKNVPIEVNSRTLNSGKQSEPKSTNPFDEDDDDVEEEICMERKSINTSEYQDNFTTSVEGETLQTNRSSDLCEFEGKNLIKGENRISVEIKVSESALTNVPAEDYNSNIDLKPKSIEESIANQTDETEPTSEVKTDSSMDTLPGCSNQQSNFLESSVKMIPIKTASESPSTENVDEAGVVADEERPPRPNSLELPQKITVDASSPQSPERATGELVTELGGEDRRLGKISPFWVPDTEANMCMQCQLKFTVIKRRHHCRACGQVLCYKCCGLKARLEYMNFAEARVCLPCFTILEAVRAAESSNPLGRQPNPNNPMEYCSTIPPLQQAAGSMHQPPPSVMVPVGVLKREGRVKSEVTKQVMFSDGIRPGGDLTELDGSGEPRMPFRRPGRLTKRVGTPPGGMLSPTMRRVMDPTTHSFIPAEGDALPPVVTRLQAEVSYSDLESPISLNQPSVKFALNRNLFVSVQRVMLDCCVNRESWCFCSEGLACVGQDEIVFLLECLPQENLPPKDIFFLINSLYQDAAKGSTVSEMSFTPTVTNTLLGSRDHGGFLYIRTSYQCTAQLSLPPPPYLVALLIHRWETPWARLFPLRLVLRLGAEFRYYPCPLVSVRNRPPLYTDIGHTIINILADFRKYSYTLPSVRGLVIHMEDRQTTINIPRNRYDQVVRALNNSNDSVLAFGANLSLAADSHLVCMQSSEDENTSYHTQAINIHNKPRKVTGASFVVFNGALKVPGLAGKSNIVEDGFMVQVPGETMTALRTALRDMRDYTVGCGPNAEETVVLQWTADDTNFNIGVKSCIDGKALDGVPSIRVHNGTDYSGGTRIIRWTEVFILQCEDSEQTSEPVDISRVSERIARATCVALVQLLDLLTAAGLTTLAVRATIHPDNVGYEAGSNGEKLPPLYMKSLDNELVAVVHQAALSSQENPAVLELVFRVMEQG